MRTARRGERRPRNNARGAKAPSRAKLRQWWLIAFVLGASMINYPFLQIFNRPVLVGGFPLLFLYFMVGWSASIAIIALYARILGRLPPHEEA